MASLKANTLQNIFPTYYVACCICEGIVLITVTGIPAQISNTKQNCVDFSTQQMAQGARSTPGATFYTSTVRS
jgi:hypothetical protein